MPAAEELVRGQLPPAVGKSRGGLQHVPALTPPRGRCGGTRSRERSCVGNHQLVVTGENDSALPDSGEGPVL